MKKVVLCLLIFLSLTSEGKSKNEVISPPATSEALPSIAPAPQAKAAIQEQCLNDCKTKNVDVGAGGVTCEQICGVAPPKNIIPAPNPTEKGFVEENVVPNASPENKL